MDHVSPTERLILGHLPLVGVSYQSRERDEEYRRRFSDIGAIREVIEAAVRMGVKTFAAASPRSSPLAPLHLAALRDLIDGGCDLRLIPCIGIPIKLGGRGIDTFRRWATYLTLEARLHPGVEERVLDDPILNFREGWRRRLPASRPYGEEDFGRLRIDWDRVEDDLEEFVDWPVSHMEPGSETDFLAMTGRLDLIGGLVDVIRERGFEGVLLGVHHAGVTIPRIDEEVGGFDGYLTPLNSLGVMMLPTKASAEKAVKGTKHDVYAIKPLAGGRIEPTEAFRYVFGFDVKGCMIGAGSAAEVEEDIKAALEVLNRYRRKSNCKAHRDY